MIHTYMHAFMYSDARRDKVISVQSRTQTVLLYVLSASSLPARLCTIPPHAYIRTFLTANLKRGGGLHAAAPGFAASIHPSIHPLLRLVARSRLFGSHACPRKPLLLGQVRSWPVLMGDGNRSCQEPLQSISMDGCIYECVDVSIYPPA